MINKFLFLIAFCSIVYLHFSVIHLLQKEEKKSVVHEFSSMPIPIQITKMVIKEKQTKEITEVKKEPEKPVEQKVAELSVIEKPIEKKKSQKESKKVQKKEEILQKEVVKRSEKEISKEKKGEEVVKRIEPKVVPVNKVVVEQKKSEKFVSIDVKDVIKNAYLSKLRTVIESNKIYPNKAKRLKQQGNVIVSFEILKSGKITSVKLKDACTYTRLNEAAVKLLLDLNFFEPIPDALGKSIWAIEVPISYKIINI